MLSSLPNELLTDIFSRVRHDTCALYTEAEAHAACTTVAKAAGCQPPAGAWLFTVQEAWHPAHYVKRNYLLEAGELRGVKKRRYDDACTYNDRECRAVAFRKFNLSAVRFGAARVASMVGVGAELAESLCSVAYLEHVARARELPDTGDADSGEAWRLETVARELEKHRLRPAFHPALRDFVRGEPKTEDRGETLSTALEVAVDAYAEPLLGPAWWRERLDVFLADRPDGLPLNLVDALAKERGSVGASGRRVTAGAHIRARLFEGRPWLRRASLREAIDHVLLSKGFDAGRLAAEDADAFSEMSARHGGIELSDIQEHAWTEWLLGEYRAALANVAAAKGALAPFVARGLGDVWYDRGRVMGVGRHGLLLEDLPWRSWYRTWLDDCVAFMDYASMAEEADGVLRRWEEVMRALAAPDAAPSVFGSKRHKAYILFAKGHLHDD